MISAYRALKAYKRNMKKAKDLLKKPPKKAAPTKLGQPKTW